MRQIVLDTETTGLEPELNHRIIEIGCVELLNRRRTGRSFHRYLNPEREIDDGALAVHGISRTELDGQPRFAQIAEELLAFLEGAELVIHNAAFDVAFLDAELTRLPGPPRTVGSVCKILDTLALARELHPGQRNSLDALCKRYEVDNSARELHGALLDARILADVYLAMTGGQAALALTEAELGPPSADGARHARAPVRTAVPLPIPTASAEELAAHEAMLALITRVSGGRCVWAGLETVRVMTPPDSVLEAQRSSA
ncbi:MAG: DNA polymerase III subunit epsilon [Gammaproteobacteria bacterium]|nr:DNA polymerase III subunit epsilon [Gammaproteobacteria bacterium]MBV9620556.1 DNA polymerase III subunit epsilon [Gammaproteobacteria bacterium]